MVSGNVSSAAASSGQPPTNTMESIANDLKKVDIVKSETNAPTDSHALAHADVEETSLIYKASGNDASTADVGWWQQPHEFDDPIVGGISNEDLWMLVRRFNKVWYTVEIGHMSCIGT